MILNASTVHDILVIHLPTRFDTNFAQEAESDLKTLLPSSGNYVLFDCQEMEYISSAGIRVLLSATKNLMKSGKKVAFCSVHSYAKEVFEMGGFLRIFTIYDSQDIALKMMK